MKSPFNDERFISKRNLWNEQALSADVIFNDTDHTQPSTADYPGKQTQR